MIRKLLFCTVILTCAACTAPALVTRPVHVESSWFVRLDAYADSSTAGTGRYDHPAAWTDAELDAILGRLLVQERGGLLDPNRLPRGLFSTRDIERLAPQLREAFRQATSAEWVSFVLTDTVGSEPVVTSGAFFVLDRRLHVVLANDRESVAASPETLETLRANPLRSLKGTKASLAFEPARFMAASRAHWSGGSAPAGSELVLNHREFLDSLRRPAVMAPGLPAGSGESSRPLMAEPSSKAEPPDEIEFLKRRVQELESELARLKQRLTELESLRSSQSDQKQRR